MHLLIDALRNSILITGLVTVMMMMIESINIESRGLMLEGLRKTKTGQVIIAALLGSIPGCMGGFATVSLYTHGLFSFGALVAMMIATSGDEAFVMLAMIPEKALFIFTLTFAIAVTTGIITDFVKDRISKKGHRVISDSSCTNAIECKDGYVVHEDFEPEFDEHTRTRRHFGLKRISMFIGLAIFIAALGTGQLGHEHHDHAHQEPEHTESQYHQTEKNICTEQCHTDHDHKVHINLLSEDWMNMMFAGLSVIVLIVLILASDHFIEEHLWTHIVKKHLPVIFAWTFGVLLVINFGLQYIDIDKWISDNTFLMILLAALVGTIPESGPHMIFVTLYAAGVVPMPVLVASCISQDGHASIPLLAESKKSFALAKLLNVIIAIAAGLAMMIF